ncbi:MAG TPA: serine hydrolase [Bacteroidales bacterium]|nr:serine hydrolase [Bacteroidales bacterium]
MKIKIINLLLLALFANVTLAGQAQSIDKQKQARLESYVASYYNQGSFNGVVMVAEKGKPILSKGYGYANVEWQVPNTPQTKFLLASISKTFTATMVMKLVDQGKLSLDTRLSDVLKWYRQDVGSKVTIRHLLNHTSGIPNYFGLKRQTVDDIMKEFGNGPINKTDFAKKYCMSDLDFEPGSKWMYDNSAYFLLGLIIEEVNGTSYEKALQDLVLKPLGMSNSGDRQPDPYKVIDKLATGYMHQFSTFSYPAYWNMSTAYSAGSIYSTLEDLLKYDRAFYSETFLSKASRDAMFTPGLNNYGCGWELREVPVGIDSAVKKIRTHEGFLMAWHTRFYQIPDEQYLVIILSNAGNAPLEKMFKGITDILYNRKPANMKPLVAFELSKSMQPGKIDSQLEKFRNSFKTEKDKWDFNEAELNRLGYATLLKDTASAVKVFGFITELYPGSWNAWDSFAEGLVALGNKQEAIKAYEKSIELNPDHKAGKEALLKLKEK